MSLRVCSDVSGIRRWTQIEGGFRKRKGTTDAEVGSAMTAHYIRTSLLKTVCC